MRKIFLTGSSGIFGTNLLSIENSRNEFHCLIHKKKLKKQKNIFQYKIDNYNKTILRKLISEINPEIIIHSAALADIDTCEKNIKECYKININFTKYLVEISKQFKIKFVYVSSDQIYDGKKNIYNERCKTNPINNYGKSKVLSENFIKKKLSNYLILRTNFYGVGTKYKLTFSEFIINKLRNNMSVDLFNDVFFNPVYLPTLIKYIFILINNNHKGTFNICSDDYLSKYELGINIAKTFNLNKDLINPISIQDLNLAANRPSKMYLDNKKLKKFLNIKSLKANYQIKDYYRNELKIKKSISQLL